MEDIDKYIFIIAIIIIVIILGYIYNNLSKQTANCTKIAGYIDNMPVKLSDLPTITTSTTVTNKTMFDVSLNRVFVKTAYNCCCTGNYKNDYVGTCALDNCYKQGVRALHFEIYLLNNKPIISCSIISQPKYKEIFNHLDFYTTMKYINTKFLTDNNDPLFLILEINSNLYQTYASVYSALYTIFGAGSTTGNSIMLFDSTTSDFSNIKLYNLIDKVVIMTSFTADNRDNYIKSGLKNITAVDLSFSDSYKITKNTDLLNTISSFSENESNFKSNLQKYNNGLQIITPNKETYTKNYDFIGTGIRYGFTFIGLSLQYNDGQITNFNTVFKPSYMSTGSFLLKNYKSTVDKSTDDTAIYYSPTINAYKQRNAEELVLSISAGNVNLYKNIYN